MEWKRQHKMARASTLTLLPLDRYAELMTIPLTWFNQMNGPKAPLGGGCAAVWDQDSREALAWTIAQAEEMIAIELGYWPAPKWFVNERLPFNLTGIRSDWQNAELETKWAYVECFGTEQLTLVFKDATVEYLNLDNDPLDREETAEIGNWLYTDLPACADPCDVAVFFREEDGADDPADPRWEIRPITVDIDGTTMKIRAESSLFIRPDLLTLTQSDCLGSDEPRAWEYNFGTTNLVSKVDVYCRTCSCETPVTLLWDNAVCGCGCTGVCQHATQKACAYATDKEHGFFIPRPATWNGSVNVDAAPTYYAPPESVKVSYKAGYPLNDYCRMDTKLERAIVKLTNALLPEPPCGYCNAAQQRWQADRTAIDPSTPEAAAMPWDMYTRGALEAWRIIKMKAMGAGSKTGR